MCKQSSNYDATALIYLPDILNLTCYLADPARWPTFAAYNADIRASMQAWSNLLAEKNTANCTTRNLEWQTSLWLFY